MKYAITGLVSAIVGGLIVGIVGFYSLPGLMMLEDESAHDFETTIEVLEQELDNAGWSVLTVHDMQETLEGHGHDVMSVKIYELCSSKYSAEILQLDDERIVSPMMPCRVAIYEKSNGNTYIARMDSELLAKPFGGVINEVMQSAASEIEDVLVKLIK
ncbi:MAG: DUF302 domain-containing protein [Balneolaceae bacterium]|nr:DUF302 domain-containing protein [Balneolaceae bacterium]MCH8548893.1 DUF302 domain-containing protein [Balneolaceae bacterium]